MPIVALLYGCENKTSDQGSSLIPSFSQPADDSTKCNSPVAMTTALQAAGGAGAENVLKLDGPETLQSVEGTRQCRGQVRIKDVLLNDPAYTAKVNAHYQRYPNSNVLFQQMHATGYAIEYSVSSSEGTVHVRATADRQVLLMLQGYVLGLGTKEGFAKVSAGDAALDARDADLKSIGLDVAAITQLNYWPDKPIERHGRNELTQDMDGKLCMNVLAGGETAEIGPHGGTCMVRWIDGQPAYVFGRLYATKPFVSIYFVYPDHYVDIEAESNEQPHSCILTLQGTKAADMSPSLKEAVKKVCS
jgi:hypothetical protein